LSEHRSAALKFEVEGLPVDSVEHLTLDPMEYWNGTTPPDVRRPEFLPIVASNSLATVLARKATGRVNGFIVEGPTAGGHNAPPRGAPQHNQRGEPLYGDRDVVDLDKLAELGLPFWLAGGAGNPHRLQEALSRGAAGVQVGTLFAFCEESGLDPDLRRSVLASAAQGKADVFTSARASPTGYPFKVVNWPEDATASVPRKRVCDLGYLRTAYVRPDGKIDYRCASEPVDAFLKKGGREEDTDGRQCLCNRLMATIGQGQLREGDTIEPPIVTSGDDLMSIAKFLDGRDSYSAAEVISYLLGEAPS
jgi:NAD(P)H-dependent flavin oxidoreductase YrpB (nitropropane dioxygenase family)